MSTRGFVGFVADGTEKIAYNHSDSYPGGLGVDVLSFARSIGQHRDEWADLARSLRVVDPESEPTDDDIASLQAYYNPNVGGRSERPSWYQLLRGTQGDPAAMLRAGVIEDASKFPAGSLFAEYGYVIDLDANALEAYVGFQKDPHKKGRFAEREPRDTGYYPVALEASWPLDALPTDEAFLAAFEGEDD